MAQTNAFENLPSEIHIHIMLDLEDLKSLYDLICASPRLLHVFGANKAPILRDIALQSFHPSVRLDALSVARVSELPHPIPREVATKLLSVPIEERRDRLTSVTSIKRSVALCKLSNLIDFFIMDYAVNTLTILERLEKPIETRYSDSALPSSRYSLSRTEYARLQRAFCRFELYCHMFSVCKPVPETCHILRCRDPIPGSEQARLFLLQFEVSEIVEIHCVRDYLERRLLGAFDEVEDYAVKVPRPRYFDLGDPCAHGVDGCPSPFKYGRYRIEEIIEHLSSLGLEYVRRIFETQDNEEKTDLMLHGCYICCDTFHGADFLSRALDLGVWPSQRTLEDYEGDRGAWSDSIAEEERLPLSAGWKWIRDGDHESYQTDPHGWYMGVIRDWGYVFWDYERLELAGILDLDLDWLGCQNPNPHYEDRKSVQERLMGTEKEREGRLQRRQNKKYELEDADQDSEEEFEERDRLRHKRL